MLNLIPHIHIPIYDSFLCSVVFLNIVTTIFIMASSARTGFIVVCTSGGLDANVARFTERKFEVDLNCWVERAIGIIDACPRTTPE